jgi:hypothetical protein
MLSNYYVWNVSPKVVNLSFCIDKWSEEHGGR